MTGSMHEPTELANAYWEHYRRATSTERVDRLRQAETLWAWDEVEDRIREEPEAMIEVLVVMADAAPDDGALAYLGAGPIESLIRNDTSSVVIDRIEAAARRDLNFRNALRCARFDDYVSPEVAERLRRFGEPF